ncbi:MAG: hypothetical protein RL660_393 [Bacteroidota bacterium]
MLDSITCFVPDFGTRKYNVGIRISKSESIDTSLASRFDFIKREIKNGIVAISSIFQCILKHIRISASCTMYTPTIQVYCLLSLIWLKEYTFVFSLLVIPYLIGIFMPKCIIVKLKISAHSSICLLVGLPAPCPACLSIRINIGLLPALAA